MRIIRSSRPCVSFILGVALVVTSLARVSAQQPAAPKRPITHKDYDTWHSIQSPQISRDGKFVAYAYMAQDADSEIVVRNVTAVGAGVEFVHLKPRDRERLWRLLDQLLK